ncbi:unnamed protein product [Darwinula stevensoni]|uniref:Death domain-containing protein n=1 Tax=Darwinula stevensoni TaxID=69355 RepID=A0A7R8XBV1_9CRUS|nr:unnamed protein product [Darwinula stevensoni]CAG0891533.1 unnamed protein product [Darwinula stevensoni]
MNAAADILARHTEDLDFINEDAVLLDLRVQGIVQHHEYFDVLNKTKREKVLFLQKVLPMRGDNAFPTFIQVLHKNGHVILADCLNKEWERTRSERHGASSREGQGDAGRKEMTRLIDVTPGAHSGSTASASIQSVEQIKRLRAILHERNTIISISDFILQLSGEDLISISEETDINKKESYSDKMNHIFSILFNKDPVPTYKRLIKVLEAMERDDLIDRLESGAVQCEPPRSIPDIIQAKWGTLIDCLKVDEIANRLLKSGVLSQGDRDEIMTPRREKERRIALLAKLTTRDDSKTFGEFLKALQAVGQDFLFQELKSQGEGIERETRDEEAALMSEAPSDDDNWEIANMLKEKAGEWKELGRELGVGEGELRKIEEKKKNPLRTTYLLLQKWKDSSSQRSTFGALCNALREQAMKTEADRIAFYVIAKRKATATPLLDELPSDENIWEIAGKLQGISDEWEDLGRELGIAEEQLRRIREMNKGPLRTVYLLLAQWRKASSVQEPSTFRALYDALLKQGMKLEADEIINLLCKKKSDDGRATR